MLLPTRNPWGSATLDNRTLLHHRGDPTAPFRRFQMKNPRRTMAGHWSHGDSFEMLVAMSISSSQVLEAL